MRVSALLLFAAFSGGLAAPPESKEALDVTGPMPSMVDNYLESIARPYWKGRARRIADLRIPAAIRERQRWARREFLQMIGGLPDKTPLNARITGEFDRDGYRVENLIFESMPGMFVTANLYIPRGNRSSYPAVLGAAGHTDASKAEPNFQRVWISLARRGYVVIAYDPPAQGERVIHYDPAAKRPRAGLASGEHTAVGLQCLLTGENIARYFVWDAIRALDYLVTRPEVDPNRIAITGVSGGGMQAAYLALLEPRLAAAGPACWMTSTEKWFTELGPQDAEQNAFPMIASGFGVEDFALGFAPRPFAYFTATRDFFPIAGARAAFEESRRIWGAMGSAANVEFHEYEDQHSWSKPRREATYRWLQKKLNNRPDDDGKELDFMVEPRRVLDCTPTGQLATSLKGENAFTANRARAERLARERPLLDPSSLTASLRSKLAFRRLPAPAVEAAGGFDRPGYRVEKLVLKTEPGIAVPAFLFRPTAPPRRKAAVLFVDGAGKARTSGPGDDIEALALSGHIVLAPDLRGMGESAASPAGATEGHTGRYKTALRALHVGKPLAGMQVADLLACFDYLTSRPDVDENRIFAMGKENGGVIVLFGALLEPRIAKVAVEGALSSYLDLARAEHHRGFADLVIPGVLHSFDIPDVIRAIAPRTVWTVDPVLGSQAGSVLAPVRRRAAGQSFQEFYGTWLRGE